MQSFKDILTEHENVYLFEIEQGRILFRLLPYRDYATFKYILQTYPKMKWEIEDQIWHQCVVEHTFGFGSDYIEAGVVTTVANIVLWFSCSKTSDEANVILDASRVSIQDAVQQAVLFVCEAFPSYLPETLEKLTWVNLMKRLAQAEVILNKSFEFKAPAGQDTDDSGKIFERLDEVSESSIDDIVHSNAVDFDKVNNGLMQEEFSAPEGDFNLRNIRG